MALVVYKFRMYPTPKQEKALEENLETCRRLFNDILSTFETYRKNKQKISEYSVNNMITQWKKTNPFLKKVYSKVLQMVSKQVFASIKGLSQSKKNGNKVGKLRYRGRGRYKTLNFNQSGFDIYEDKNCLRLSKIGIIKTIVHREIDGKIKGIIVKKTKLGKWYANVQIDKEFQSLPKTGKDTGIDVGIAKFVTDTEKDEFEYPNNIDKTLKKIKSQQRVLSRKKKGSQNYYKAREILAKTYESLKHQRTDYLHKMSSYYILNYDMIAHEDLDIMSMLQRKTSKSLNRHIADASWGTFFTMLEDKAERAGRIVEKVNPKNTTQKCSICKNIVPKQLSDRQHTCPHCGHDVPRDYNAAQNVLYDAYSQHGSRGQGLSPLSVEKNPLLNTISHRDIVAGKIFC